MCERTRVSLWLRIKTESGNGVFRPAVPKKNLYALVDGKAKHCAQGVYHLRYSANGRRRWEKVGGDVFTAENKRKIREGELGLNTFALAPKTPAKLTLAEQQDKFLELKRLTKKADGTKLDKETLSAYEQQTKEFLAVAFKKTYADEIDGMDLRRYMAALEARGVTHRTICNNYTSVATFLKFCGVDHKELLPQSERPRPDDGTPEAYTYDEVVRFLAGITRERDRLAFEFLLDFAEPAKPIGPIPLLKGGQIRQVQSTRYTTLGRLQNAKTLDDVFGPASSKGAAGPL